MTTSVSSASTASSSNSKRGLIGNILAGVVTLAMLASAGGKFSGAQPIIENFDKFHLSGFVTPIGVIELICALLFAVPKTSSLGTLLATGYFGGAVVAHLAGNDVAGVIPALVLGALAWVANAIRNPKMFESLSK
jgi:DoxX-like family